MRDCRLALFLLVSVLIVSAAPAAAQDPRLEAARKEGKVVWYTSLALTSSEKVAKLFETAYPGVKVEVHRTGSQRILQRMAEGSTPEAALRATVHSGYRELEGEVGKFLASKYGG